MFLPQYLREAVAKKWGITPIPIYERSECRDRARATNCIERGVDVPDDGPSGRVLFALVILALTAPVWVTRLWGRFQRTGLAVAIVPYVLLGTILTFLAVDQPAAVRAVERELPGVLPDRSRACCSCRASGAGATRAAASRCSG